MKRLRIALAVASLAALGATACASLFGFEELVATPADAAADGAAPDAGADANTTPEACKRTGAPDAPTVDVAGDAGGSGSYVLAVSTFDIGLPNDAGAPPEPIGLNLDLRCTYARGEGSCKDTADDSAFETSIKDKVDGVDSAGYALLKRLALSYTALSAESVNERLRQGEFGVVAKIDNYNGGPDDTDIQLAVQPALGVLPKDGGTTAPAFDATDRWTVDSRYFLNEEITRPRFVSDVAYVRDHKLVARFKQLLVSLTVPSAERDLDLLLDEAWLLGDLSVVNGEARLTNGIIAGRWQTPKLLGAVGELKLAGQPICQRPDIFAGLVKTYVCSAQDLAASSAEPVSAPCGAISSGFRFVAGPAHPDTFVRPPVKVTPPTDLCKSDICP